MRVTGGDQAKCATKMASIVLVAQDGRPPSMEKRMRVTGGRDQAKRAAKMAAIVARA
jgi:hypothetical protein